MPKNNPGWYKNVDDFISTSPRTYTRSTIKVKGVSEPVPTVICNGEYLSKGEIFRIEYKLKNAGIPPKIAEEIGEFYPNSPEVAGLYHRLDDGTLITGKRHTHDFIEPLTEKIIPAVKRLVKGRQVVHCHEIANQVSKKLKKEVLPNRVNTALRHLGFIIPDRFKESVEIQVWCGLSGCPNWLIIETARWWRMDGVPTEKTNLFVAVSGIKYESWPKGSKKRHQDTVYCCGWFDRKTKKEIGGEFKRLFVLEKQLKRTMADIGLDYEIISKYTNVDPAIGTPKAEAIAKALNTNEVHDFTRSRKNQKEQNNQNSTKPEQKNTFTAYSTATYTVGQSDRPEPIVERAESTYNLTTGKMSAGGNYTPLADLKGAIVKKHKNQNIKFISSDTDTNIPVDLPYFKGDTKKWIDFAIAWGQDNRPVIEKMLDEVVEQHDGPIM